MAMPGALSMFRLTALLVAIVLLLSSSEAQNQSLSISCNEVVRVITPCSPYVMQQDGKPSLACCNGVKNINDRSKTKQDRIDACNCIKQALSKVGKYNPNRISQLPKNCGFNFRLPAIDQNTDCRKVVLDGM